MTGALKNGADPRYYKEWVTLAPTGKLVVEGRRIRDSHTSGWPIVFEHEDTRVVSKMLIILNEG